jgi:hypothetical protein
MLAPEPPESPGRASERDKEGRTDPILVPRGAGSAVSGVANGATAGDALDGFVGPRTATSW